MIKANRETEPVRGFLVVLGDANAAEIPHPEAILRGCITLVSSKPVPLHGFHVVLSDAVAIGVHPTEVVLRGCMTLVSS